MVLKIETLATKLTATNGITNNNNSNNNKITSILFNFK